MQKVSKQRKSNWDPKYDAKCDLFKKGCSKSVEKSNFFYLLRWGGGTFDLSNAHSFIFSSTVCLQNSGGSNFKT